MIELQKLEKRPTACRAFDILSAFPDQCRDAWRLGEDVPLALPDRQLTDIVIVGMGGSGVAGDLAATFLARECARPVTVVKGAVLPASVSSRTVCFLVSHSGETAETLACYKQARASGALCVAVSGGGRLGARAAADGVTWVELPMHHSPRFAAAYLTLPILLILRRLGLAELPPELLIELVETVNQTVAACGGQRRDADNPACELAAALDGRLPLIWGTASCTDCIACRLQNMLAENACTPAYAAVLPELCHNLPEALPQLQALRPLIVLLRSRAEPPLVRRQIAALKKLLAEQFMEWREVWAPAASCLPALLGLLLFTDYVSVHLAYLHGHDPETLRLIPQLKAACLDCETI